MIPKALIAVAAVVILAGAGVGVYFVMNNNNDKDSGSNNLEGFAGLVYGNANGDAAVDSADVTLINKIINGDESLDKYPLADANLDGNVDDEDLQIVNKIINKQPTKITLNDTHSNVEIDFPMDKIFAAGGTNMRVLIQVLDMEPKLVACATTSYYNSNMDYTLTNLLDSGDLPTIGINASKDDFKALNVVKKEKGLNVAILENRSITGYNEDSAMAVFKDLNVSVIIMECESIFELRTSLATLGIAMAAQEKSKQMIDILDNTLDEIKNKAGEKYGTSTVMCITMSNSVSGTLSDYFAMTELAGGKNLADWTDKTRVFDKGDTWLYQSKYNPEFLFHFKSMKYGENPTASDLDAYRGYFKETNAYKAGHYYLINGVVPLHVRLAWMAQIMYPDKIDSTWSDQLFQEYLDTFGDLNEGKTKGGEGYFDVTEHDYHWSV